NLLEKLSDSIISHKIGESKSKIKDGKGFNLYIPWKAPAEGLKEGYEKLLFQKDTHWMDLVDYVFTSQDIVQSFAEEIASPEQKLSITQKFGKTLIKNYKQYVSPYLALACKHTPSCSQYGREAIEKHGLVQGSKMAFMRILGCNSEAEGKYDPVPDVPEDGGDVICNIDHGPPPAGSKDLEIPDILISPPEKVEKSRFRKAIENVVIAGSSVTGKLLGGSVGAAVALPVGLAMGAVIGTKMGKNTINEELNKPLLEKYHRDSVRQFVKIEQAVGMPGAMTYNTIKDLTGSFEITDSTIEKLQDMSGFEFTDKAIEFLSEKFTDKSKLESIKSLKGKKTTKDKLLDGMKKLGFNDKEINDFLLENNEASQKLSELKSLEGKHFTAKKLENKLAEMNFNKEEIKLILQQADFTYSNTIARTVGGLVGSVSGTIMGAIGGAVVGFQWGSKFSGLFARNYVKEKFGELPKHPITESILQRDYNARTLSVS
ncbi:MAG: membrane protein insertion efficiency factor YidD, partial [Candidatus Eremiobacterota bacterium]